jgi:hypothetical protein
MDAPKAAKCFSAEEIRAKYKVLFMRLDLDWYGYLALKILEQKEIILNGNIDNARVNDFAERQLHPSE